MNVYSMVENLDEFRVIAVTGPQRSGTTFTAKAFAHDMNRPFVDEAVFGVNDRDIWTAIIEGAHKVVVQCPTMMKYVHKVPDDVLVVVMRRAIEDILASEERIEWSDNDIELAVYDHGKTLQRQGAKASEIKYRWWDKHKHESPKNWVELEYESMSDHPLWIPKRKRKNFGPKQTELR